MPRTDSLFGQLDFAQEPRGAHSSEQKNAGSKLQDGSIQTGKKSPYKRAFGL